jgi:L-iditol 2-dehydrogenase
MRIAELFEKQKFRIVSGSNEDPGPHEVQVRVEAVGICGSDLHEFAEGGIGGRPCGYPLTMGHEPTGVVVKTGPAVTGCSPGERAAIEPAVYCYRCEFCLAGCYNLCANMRFYSSPGEPGFFREYANVPVESILPLPDGVSFVQGTLFEPLAVVLESMKLAALNPLETAVVFGAGPIGLLTILMLKMRGAGGIWAVEPVPHRREMARAAGADALLDPREVDPAREILSDTGNRGVDVAIDCAARENSMNLCMRAMRKGGRLVVTGIPSELEVPLEMHTARRKGLSIYNTRRSNHTSKPALQLLARHPDWFRPILTHTFPLDRIQYAFQMLENYSDGAGKVVIQPQA